MHAQGAPETKEVDLAFEFRGCIEPAIITNWGENVGGNLIIASWMKKETLSNVRRNKPAEPAAVKTPPYYRRKSRANSPHCRPFAKIHFTFKPTGKLDKKDTIW